MENRNADTDKVTNEAERQALTRRATYEPSYLGLVILKQKRMGHIANKKTPAVQPGKYGARLH